MMNNQVWVRHIESTKDVDLLESWLNGTKNNLFDMDVLSYPKTQIFVAHKQQPLVMVPVQMTFTMESLAINPEGSELEIAESLRQLTKHIVYKAHELGIKEINFFCADERTSAFAAKYFEEIPHRAFRLKLNSLEAK